eukprot:gene4694-3387_t
MQMNRQQRSNPLPKSASFFFLRLRMPNDETRRLVVLISAWVPIRHMFDGGGASAKGSCCPASPCNGIGLTGAGVGVLVTVLFIAFVRIIIIIIMIIVIILNIVLHNSSSVKKIVEVGIEGNMSTFLSNNNNNNNNNNIYIFYIYIYIYIYKDETATRVLTSTKINNLITSLLFLVVFSDSFITVCVNVNNRFIIFLRVVLYTYYIIVNVNRFIRQLEYILSINYYIIAFHWFIYLFIFLVFVLSNKIRILYILSFFSLFIFTIIVIINIIITIIIIIIIIIIKL